MNDIFSMVADLGFPIAVAFYLLIRIEGKLGELTIAITELREAIITLPNHLSREGSLVAISHELINGSSHNQTSPLNSM